MGWSFYSNVHSRASLVNMLRAELEASWGADVKFAAVGNHLWVSRGSSGIEGMRRIALFLMAGSGKSLEGWGYKSMGEDTEPYYYSCPLGMVEEAGGVDAPGLSDYARRWRYANVLHQSNKKALKKIYADLRVGDVITARGGQVMTVQIPSMQVNHRGRISSAVVSVDQDSDAPPLNYTLPERNICFSHCQLIQRGNETIYVGVDNLPKTTR